MPPVCLHLAIADEAARRLDDPLVNRHRGWYLLGCTSPDMRIVTRVPREETHFFDLEEEAPQSGERGLFERYPELQDGRRMAEWDRVFVAGYLSHLVTDEAWILNVYRPQFGRYSPLAANALARLLDRVLQFELDRREREDQERMAAWRREIVALDIRGRVGHIERDTLQRWREFVESTLTQKPDWERFQNFGRRYAEEAGTAEEEVSEVFADLPSAAQRALGHLAPGVVETFLETSVASSVAAACAYFDRLAAAG